MAMMINKARSFYKTSPQVLTTFDTSYLIPLKCLKVIPNGTYKLTAGCIARLPALKVPVMGSLSLEFFAFYVPLDLLDKKFEKLITEGHDNSYDEDAYGQGSQNPNPESVGASIIPDLLTPKLVDPDNKDGFEVHSGDVLNRLGLPIANVKAHNRSVKYNQDLLKSLQEKYNNVEGGANLIAKEYAKKKVREVPSYIPNGKYCAYPVRGYHLIFNHSFRSKFLQSPKIVDYGFSESNPHNYELLRVNRVSDWFSRGYVSAQLNPVNIPLGPDTIAVDYGNGVQPVFIDDFTQVPIVANDGFQVEEKDDPAAWSNLHHKKGTFGTDYIYGDFGSSATEEKIIKYRAGLKLSDESFAAGYFTKQDLGGQVSLKNTIALGLNDLRYIIGLSHISEKALYGTDMDTILKMNFNLTLPRTCLKEPYLFGYKKIPITINQVTQTAPSDDDTSNIGDVYGQSTTITRLDDNSFTFRSYNYGYIYLMCCVRHESVYQYGVDPIFTENDKFDYFQPDLQGLSNIGIPKKYIYFTGTDSDDEVFNFNEPFSDLKHDYNVVNGEFSSDADTPLDFYHLADIYNDVPSYDDKWIKDTTKEVLDRSLTITSQNANQVHFYMKTTYERVLPMSDYFVGFDYI